MATKTRKPLQALGLADNFLFGEVMQDMGLCKLFLEALLQRPIAKIVNISKEKDLSDAYLAHGIRLDVDLEDENRTRYNIEMQGSSQKSIGRRVRYYQSGIDRHFLEQGTDYDSLPNSFVIFVCDYDPYGKGLCPVRARMQDQGHGYPVRRRQPCAVPERQVQDSGERQQGHHRVFGLCPDQE